jgi:hypothetical protein
MNPMYLPRILIPTPQKDLKRDSIIEIMPMRTLKKENNLDTRIRKF